MLFSQNAQRPINCSSPQNQSKDGLPKRERNIILYYHNKTAHSEQVHGRYFGLGNLVKNSSILFFPKFNKRLNSSFVMSINTSPSGIAK